MEYELPFRVIQQEVAGGFDIKQSRFPAGIVPMNGNAGNGGGFPPRVGLRPILRHFSGFEKADVRVDLSLAMRHQQGQFTDAGTNMGSAGG